MCPFKYQYDVPLVSYCREYRGTLEYCRCQPLIKLFLTYGSVDFPSRIYVPVLIARNTTNDYEGDL